MKESIGAARVCFACNKRQAFYFSLGEIAQTWQDPHFPLTSKEKMTCKDCTVPHVICLLIYRAGQFRANHLLLVKFIQCCYKNHKTPNLYQWMRQLLFFFFFTCAASKSKKTAWHKSETIVLPISFLLAHKIKVCKFIG